MIDFHSHILPGMDDGSKDAAQSIEMLLLAGAAETDTIVATPHFQRRKETVDSFLERRRAACIHLEEAMAGKDGFPQILLGAETEFFLGIGREAGIKKLCIPGTDCFLLEMPFCEWSSLVMNDIQALCCNRGLTPIIAHVERFFRYRNSGKQIDALLELGCVLQTNAESVLCSRNRRKILHMIGNDEITLLGSDCHGITSRPPGLLEARRAVISKLGLQAAERLDRHGEELLNSARIGIDADR